MIEGKNITVCYGDKEAVKKVSLTIEDKEILCIVGPNGCGKTTLLKALSGLLPLTEGNVSYGGRDIESFARKEFARMRAVLPQVRDVPALQAERFISHGRYPHLSFGRQLTQRDKEIVEKAMEDTGVTALRKKELPHLSGGERQRVYLAMALAQDAEVLFLDEPTTYLDIGQKYQMMELIKKINRMGKTVVMVLHDLPLAFSYSHRVAVMEKGQLLMCQGAHEVFDSGVPARVFGVSAQRIETPGGTEFIFRGQGGQGHEH